MIIFYGQCVRTGNYHDPVDTEKLTMELRKKSMVGPKYRSLSDGESLFLRLCTCINIFTRLMFFFINKVLLFVVIFEKKNE